MLLLVIPRLTHASELSPPRNKGVKVMSEEHREAKKLGLRARMWEKKDGWVNSEEKKLELTTTSATGKSEWARVEQKQPRTTSMTPAPKRSVLNSIYSWLNSHSTFMYLQFFARLKRVISLKLENVKLSVSVKCIILFMTIFFFCFGADDDDDVV